MSTPESKDVGAQDPARENKQSGEATTQPPVIDNSESMDGEALQEAYEHSFKNIVEGSVVAGVVLKLSSSNVVVDVGFKSEGLIPLEEFRDKEGNISVEVGDTLDVFLERTEDRHGHVVISRQKAERMKVWESLEQAYHDETIISGRVIERIKGGLAVDVGVRAFLPGSQVDVQPVRNMDSLCGKELEMRVIKVNRRRGNIVLSRKAILEEETSKMKEQTLKELEEGKVIPGIVKNTTDYGAFVDLGGIDGLLHITDMSWGRVNHPSDLFEVGDEIEVKILKFDPANGKVSLGYKQLGDDPWASAQRRYTQGARVFAKVVSLTDYGAFVELEEGVEGLIHISEMSWNKRVKHPSKILSIGDEVECVVLEIDTEGRRISLGTKQTEDNPWGLIEERYAVNSIVSGEVCNLTDFGAFIEMEEGVEGLVHISDLSWTKKIQHPSEVLAKGDKVEAVVLNVDAAAQRLSLGIKQLEPDKWEEFFSQHQIGDVVTGTVARTANFGAFVEVGEGVEGLCHVSEFSDQHVEDPETHFKIDQEIEVKIIKLNLLERKIGLSAKSLQEGAEGDANWSYTPEVATASIGDIAGKELGELKKRAGQAEGDGDDES